jgi:NADP-reducing hydrogenase subunit HndB
MTKVKTIEDLRKMRDELQQSIRLLEDINHPGKAIQVKVGLATSGIAAGAKEVMDFMTDALDKRNIDAVVTQTGDMGYCFAEPTIEVTLPGEQPVLFGYVDVEKADEIIEKYIKNGELLEGILPQNYETIDEA